LTRHRQGGTLRPSPGAPLQEAEMLLVRHLLVQAQRSDPLNLIQFMLA
jgi:hypothetical protein